MRALSCSEIGRCSALAYRENPGDHFVKGAVMQQFTLIELANPNKLLSAERQGQEIYAARFLLAGPDIAILVTADRIQTFVNSTPALNSEHSRYVAHYEGSIRQATFELLRSGTRRVVILGRWVTLRGLSGVEAYAVQLQDASGVTTLHNYSMRIFPNDDEPFKGLETTFAGQTGLEILATLMELTELKLCVDQVPEATIAKGYPSGMFWFSSVPRRPCFAYQAVGRPAFSKTIYARALQELRAAQQHGDLNGKHGIGAAPQLS